MEYDLVHKQSKLSQLVSLNNFPIHSVFASLNLFAEKQRHYTVMKNYTDTGMFELIGAVIIHKSENIAIVIFT